MTPTLAARVDGLYVGRPSTLPDGRRSAIVKHAVTGPVALTETTLVGDQVANRRVHGGPEMALHLMPAEHYAAWRAVYDECAALRPGTMGENLSTYGLTEENVHCGDVFSLGTARVQVSQPRMPCGNIDARYGVDGLAVRIMEAGQCGWYFRVLTPGIVAAGQTLQLETRLPDSLSLAEIWAVQNGHPVPLADLQRAANAPGLTPKWRARFAARAAYLLRRA